MSSYPLIALELLVLHILSALYQTHKLTLIRENQLILPTLGSPKVISSLT